MVLERRGPTFARPVKSMWAAAFAKKGTNVAYQAIGSGGGVSQINAQTVDFGASDTPMPDSELAAAKGGPILHIPLVLGAVAVAYNIKGVGPGLNFDADTIGKIFTGQITKWNDPAIKALDPKSNLPDQTIAVVHRSDSSGTTGVFTDFLTKASPAWVAKLGAAASRTAPLVAGPSASAARAVTVRPWLLDQPDQGLGRLRRAAVRDRRQARLRQRQEQEGHVHQALHRDGHRRCREDLLPG